jgi:hypothetical protein
MKARVKVGWIEEIEVASDDAAEDGAEQAEGEATA